MNNIFYIRHYYLLFNENFNLICIKEQSMIYTFFIMLLIITSSIFFYRGVSKKRKGLIISGLLIAISTFVFFAFLNFWADKLWYDSLGFQSRFWTEVLARLFSFITGAGLSMLLIFLFTLTIKQFNGKMRWAIVSVSGLYGGLRWAGNWQNILKFLNSQSSGISDPIHSLDAGFYMFTLPFLDFITGFTIVLGLMMLALAVLSKLRSGMDFLSHSPRAIFDRMEQDETAFEPRSGGPALPLAIIFLFTTAGAGFYLNRFHLLYNSGGIIDGPGWTDVNIRIPLLALTSGLTILLSLTILIPGIRKIYSKPLAKTGLSRYSEQLQSGIGLSSLILTLWFLLLGIIPWGAQTLFVRPNEITYERPYIKHNIENTLQGYKLSEITEKEFDVSENLTQESLQNNPGILNNIRLWDWRALKSVYSQFQEIRLYYKFNDIDIDRYMLEDEYRSIMISAREMDTSNLPEKSQTFVNKRFKYTHGYGVAMNTVNEFTPSGLPHFLIKDIPPQNEYPSLAVERPEIYYGESTQSYVVANSTEKEFNYPSGDANAYSSYQGVGGVPISNFFRKFLFGWKFKSTQFLFSGYQTPESRIMFNRNIHDRVQKAAPFLKFDRDPYIVLSKGKLYWIYDAYTFSRRFPYSRHFRGETFSNNQTVYTENPTQDFYNINYIRNSVKVIIDPYNGNMDFYIYDDDSIIEVWNKIYPDMFHPKEDMPLDLQRHVRYPSDLLLVQGSIYAKYHMQDPEVFYNQEDLWVRATEKYYNNVRPVEPYYVMWQQPGRETPEFVNMLPYTPKNRQVLISWIAGTSDPENYGEFIAYKFPKDKRILGTQQVETKIDQDSFLSGQLTLWDQRGSNVIRGNVLVIPLDGTIVYIEPIYLQSETAAYPELRLVAVMHNDNLSYAESFTEALSGLFKQGDNRAEITGESGTRDSTATGSSTKPFSGDAGDLAKKAQQAFNSYLTAQGNKDFDSAAESLKDLQDSLQQLIQQYGETSQ